VGLFDSFLVAGEALLANKLRACLTMLGLVIGVGAVIALMAVGQGSQKSVTEQISGLGTNLLFVRPGAGGSSGVSQGPGSAQTLTQQDAEAIASNVADVIVAAPQQNAGAQLVAGGQNTFADIAGVTPDYVDVASLQVAKGAFFSQDDVDSNARVAVLGSALAQQLFPNGGDPIGQSLKLTAQRNTITFKIVGVLRQQGGNAQSSSDNRIMIPLTTVQKQVAPQRSAQNTAVVSQITVKVATKEKLQSVKQSITDLLLQRHNAAQADFTVESQDDLAAAANQVAATMTLLLGSIAGISLLVGGIGIMNIMLVSVTERTREIGIRKAVGARQADILTQFLTEALMLTVLGGLMGAALGIGVALFLDGRSIAGLGNNVQTIISWPSVAIAFAVSAGIGVFFGIYPAQRAGSLRPIDALRYE
jgi:putative ABC transport system permease protein